MTNVKEVQILLSEQIESFSAISTMDNILVSAIKIITTSLQANGTIFLCGNGGSAADAQHLAAELQGRFMKERPALSAMALTTNASSMTAIANDYGFEYIFSRQLEGLAQEGDVLLAISTSGNSDNIINAMITAQEGGITTIAFTGRKKNKMQELADLSIAVPSDSTPRIQEMHIALGHTICQIVENQLSE